MKISPILILNFIPCLVFAQEEWTAKDSIKLSKMLDGEIPIYINDILKRELEESITGYPLINTNNRMNDFILGVKLKRDLLKYPHLNSPNLHIQSNLSIDNTNHKSKAEYLKFRSLKISSNAYIDNPFFNIERNTNISIPLTKKLYFNIYGNYTLDRKRSVVLPATSIPYEVGAGFSYNIGKHATIKSETNYQYNIIKKRWEWFFGAGVTFSF